MTDRPSWIRIDVPEKYRDAVKKTLKKNCPEIEDKEVTYVEDPKEPEPDEQQENNVF